MKQHPWLVTARRRGLDEREFSPLVSPDIDWKAPQAVLSLLIAQDWAKPFAARVASARGLNIEMEAIRATIEALTRQLRSKRWRRVHSSKNRADGRMDSRYYVSPTDRHYAIRISNHAFPSGFRGAKDYVITREIVGDYNVAGLIRMIERDQRAVKKLD